MKSLEVMIAIGPDGIENFHVRIQGPTQMEAARMLGLAMACCNRSFRDLAEAVESKLGREAAQDLRKQFCEAMNPLPEGVNGKVTLTDM